MNVYGNEGGVEVGRVQIWRPGGGRKAANVDRRDEIGGVERVVSAVEAETITNIAQKVGDVADVAVFLPYAFSLRAQILTILRGRAMEIDSGELFVVGKRNGVCEVR